MADQVDREKNGAENKNEKKPCSKLRRMTRYNDGSVKLRNPNIELMDQDILYHLALGSGSHDLQEMFGDVKFVCMGGTPKRMETFAHFMMDELKLKLPAGTQLQDISAFSYRYSMYKVGPVLSVSHGMGVPSVGILLHELIKLMYHAKVKDPHFIRIGTCGGIGVEGGTVVVTEDAYDGLLRNSYELAILGRIVHRPAVLDKKLARDLKAMATNDDPYDTIIGKTMCTYDFYEGQGRLDGAFCEFSETEKMEYLEQLRDFGIVNIEMECTIFAALTHYAGIKAAVVCVTLLDRLKGDQVMAPKEVMNEWQQRPQTLVSRYIQEYVRKTKLMRSYPMLVGPIKSPRRFKLVQQESEAHE
ncbi:uridine phosphorylase 1 isoform X3 [Anopheles cruzii]|uniref:uridine phosphorylase 1 isoform X3 n=1 Tax=Anopheles cruzii TaxID=68878 RepID=UPI0022EC53DA|nr:uridine phosphorylase 1 isoform X3 [Anopheles cruzii]XP_052864731.1 uridine phosphorylase 1 isoform X3 [Anopheles cruzii]XP_052864740.1 uridine phosphorylase 1 isoform X3 [Anopheles cruzii]XP_052864748.1 uridine phosphorylase 1 isoform X3 [Anopheles cruzii]